MIGPKTILRNNLLATVLISSLVITLILAAGVVPGHAQERESVQVLTQRIEAGDVHFYQLPDLNAGETLSIYVMGTSSNLDPGRQRAGSLRSFAPDCKLPLHRMG